MKTIALLLSTLALATATVEWNDLRATWRLVQTDPLRSNSFYEIPRTLNDAVSEGWVEANVQQSLPVTTYCLTDDFRCCILFDSYGYIAGFQVNVLVSDVENMQHLYNMARINQYKRKIVFDQEVWSSTVYTQNPDQITSGGRSNNWDGLTGVGGVWFEITDGYIEVPSDLTNLNSVWTKEGCVRTMGSHYYFNMSTTIACEDIPPWFLLSQDGSLSGVGYQTFGSASIKNRNWFDVIPAGSIQGVVPDGPQCLYDWFAEYGFISLHLFFTADPWTITCS